MNPYKLKKMSMKVKNGRIIDKRGYVLIYCPSDPFNKHGYVLEHRLVCESLIGRMLNQNEVIHHIDFNRKNNDPSNLVIFPNQSEHSHWHSQYNQFGLTQPLRTKIEKLKENMK